MKLSVLNRRQRFPVPIHQAWDFFSSPANLARITPPRMRFQTTSDLPEHVHAGMIVTYLIRPLAGVPVRWVTEITHVDAPRLFVDEQRFGPYRFWHHQHHLREVEGGTEVRDLVHYALPRGTGPVAGGLVRRRLEAIFDYRTRALSAALGTLPPAAGA